MTRTVPHTIACIGAGYWGKNLIRNFASLGVLAWVCEVAPERRAELATAYPTVKCTLDRFPTAPPATTVAFSSSTNGN